MENSNLPKIYSKKTILGFSIFFSALFGGILLYQNLLNDKKKEAYLVLGVSILMTIISIIIVNIPAQSSSLAYFCGLISGCFLAYGFFPKYFPDENKYPKKTIWKPLVIGLLIVTVLFFIIIYTDSLNHV